MDGLSQAEVESRRPDESRAIGNADMKGDNVTVTERVKGHNWNVGVRRIIVGEKTYSRNEIAKGSGIDRAHVTRVFNGTRQLTLRMALKMAGYMNVSVEFLLAVVIPTNIKYKRGSTK